jgi:2-dehydro-3-deoxyphosphooctonate aldolase (KDO 8-P synthase)
MSHFWNNLGNRKPLSIIAGPCVAESEKLCREVADFCADVCDQYGINYIFKASFDKANRTSFRSYRGLGWTDTWDIFESIQGMGIEVLTDVHDVDQARSTNADVIQIPAFLCRQTDLLKAAAESGKPVNVKKGQFLAPWDIQNIEEKLIHFGCTRYMFTERGSSFGYGQLVVDMTGLQTMKNLNNCPIIMDCTHAVQRPGSGGITTDGNRELAPVLARAAVAVGIAGVFAEVHPNPDHAPSDGPNMLSFNMFEDMVGDLHRIDEVVKI